ncbi:MAG: hypothetical protein ISS78_10025, partial [Phycisphaerae bacterium]|nr:hypothetical protein [Phycisphaerae bacterium]
MAKMRKRVRGVMAVAVLCMLPGLVLADPGIDGRFDAGEYTHGYGVTFHLDGESSADVVGGQLWLRMETAAEGGNLRIAFVEPKTLVDNSYGDNAVGWPGDNHKFTHLLTSDNAQFIFKNSTANGGGTVLDVTLDYLHNDDGTFISGLDGNDGVVPPPVGSAADVVASATSLEYNLNNVAL